MLDTAQAVQGVQTVEGTVKWFSIPKGYGFIQFQDKPDALLHVTRLQEGGFDVPADGSTISCDVTDRGGKLLVVKVHSISAAASAIEAVQVLQTARVDANDGVVDAVVKWYKPDKGYGMLEQSDGPDIFVHCTTLKRCGLATLSRGSRVRATTEQRDRGLNATRIALS